MLDKSEWSSRSSSVGSERRQPRVLSTLHRTENFTFEKKLLKQKTLTKQVAQPGQNDNEELSSEDSHQPTYRPCEETQILTEE